MSFPTADLRDAFDDFLMVNTIRRHLERHRPDLLEHVQQMQGRPLIGLRLPDGRQVVCAHTRVGMMTGWACITPTSTEDDVRASMSTDGTQLAALMVGRYDAITARSATSAGTGLAAM